MKYYICSDQEMYEVSKDIRNAINQSTNRVHRREQKHLNQCAANRRGMARCEGDCYTCKHHIHRCESVNDLDARCDTQIQAGLNVSAGMDIACLELIMLIEQANPQYGRKIAEMYLRKYTDHEVAEALGIPRSTYADRKKRIADYVAKNYYK